MKFVASDYLETPEDVVQYLESVIEDYNEFQEVVAALRVIDHSKGFAQITRDATEPRVVTALMRLLSKSNTLEELIDFLNYLNVNWTMRRDGDSFKVGLRQEGMATYQETTSGISIRSAVINMLARFLSKEQRDFHEIQDRGKT